MPSQLGGRYPERFGVYAEVPGLQSVRHQWRNPKVSTSQNQSTLLAMNFVEIKVDKLTPNLTELILELSPETEELFKERIFPYLFDGKTSGSRTKLPNGHIRHHLLVYDQTLVQVFKQCLFNAMLIDNGQLN
jgi:hypothetical protein